MKVFLSWSGPRSKRVAEALGDWICQVIQAVEPWISVDVEKGARWNKEIAAQLDSTEIGIFCLTRDNLQSPWLHFEAGALSKGQDGRVCTFMLDIHPTDVKPPLSDFQATTFEREDVQKLLFSLNARLGAAGDRQLGDDLLRRLFDRFWPELEVKLKEIVADTVSSKVPERSKDDLLDEILLTVRRISSLLDGGLEKLDAATSVDLVRKLLRTSHEDEISARLGLNAAKGSLARQAIAGNLPQSVDGSIKVVILQALLDVLPSESFDGADFDKVIDAVAKKTLLDSRTVKEYLESLKPRLDRKKA